MEKALLKRIALFLLGLILQVWADNARNPPIQADVPDMAMSRGGDAY